MESVPASLPRPPKCPTIELGVTDRLPIPVEMAVRVRYGVNLTDPTYLDELGMIWIRDILKITLMLRYFWQLTQ
jgi:hypothetical protein